MAVQFGNDLRPRFVEDKPQWNTMKGVKAKFVGGKLNGKQMLVEELINHPEYSKMINGISTGETTGRWKLRDELLNQPMFNGYLSPMWDGDGNIRYETRDVYNQLSK